MKTKYLLKLVALNLALTTVFAAAIPSPSPSQATSKGADMHKNMLASMSSYKLIARINDHEKHGKILDLLKQIEDGAKKGNAEFLKARTDLVASFKAEAPGEFSAGASDEEIFSQMLTKAEKEHTEEMLAIARDLHAGATPTPAPGSRIH